MVELGRPLARRARRLARPRSRVGWTVEPVSRAYGYDRGTPVDRYYLDAYLECHRGVIRGDVLDIGDDENVTRFGHDLGRVEVLSPVAGTPGATFVGDLETGDGIPTDRYDCVLLLETLNVIYELRSAVQAVHAALRPGGVAVVSANGLAPKEHQWEAYWRLTSGSMQRLLAEAFGPEQVSVQAYGNALSATAYLYGLAAEELSPAELGHVDPHYEVMICALATKAGR
jgi:hypothetical protein